MKMFPLVYHSRGKCPSRAVNEDEVRKREKPSPVITYPIPLLNTGSSPMHSNYSFAIHCTVELRPCMFEYHSNEILAQVHLQRHAAQN
jgi:hypothetical protein